MTGKGDLLLAFTAASALHAGVLLFGPPLGGEGGGDGGEQRLTLQAATPEIVALVKEWDRQPQIFEASVPGLPEVPREVPAAIQPDTAPKRIPAPNGLISASRSIAPPVQPAATPELQTMRIEPSAAPSAAALAAPPHKQSPRTIPEARAGTLPQVDALPPVQDSAPQHIARPLQRPVPVPSPTATPRVAEGAGISGKRGSAPTASAASLSKAAQRAAASAWAAAIERRIARHHVYPRNSRDEGRVRVAMIILSDGRLSKVAVAASSGSHSLDKAAVSAVKRAAPFPPAPEALNDKFFNVGQWIVFKRR